MQIFVFGGTWTDEEDTTIYMNDLHVLDVNTFAWSKPTTSGEPPTEREGHTAATLLKKVFIFGGTWVDEDDNSIYLNDLHVLDTHGDGAVDGRWSQPRTTGMPPIQREGHTASMVRDMMIIFGGAGARSRAAWAHGARGANAPHTIAPRLTRGCRAGCRPRQERGLGQPERPPLA